MYIFTQHEIQVNETQKNAYIIYVCMNMKYKLQIYVFVENSIRLVNLNKSVVSEAINIIFKENLF